MVENQSAKYLFLGWQYVCTSALVYRGFVFLDHNDNNNDCISRAPCHVKHAQLRWTNTNIKI